MQAGTQETMSEQPTSTEKPNRKDALLAKKRAIELELKQMANRENLAQRKAETRAKIIIGGLLLTHRRDLIADLIAKADPRDLEHLKKLGIQ